MRLIDEDAPAAKFHLNNVVHAEWVLDSSFFSASIYHCTACNQKQMQASKFCPECGAKMDGDSGEEP